MKETSACIDGHKKISLNTDHLKLNKFSGPDDPSYKKVFPEIEEMLSQAEASVGARLNRIVPFWSYLSTVAYFS